jgi:hypothetical protein
VAYLNIRGALEIQGNFTGAAMHIRRPGWVMTGNHQSEHILSAIVPKADIRLGRNRGTF